VPADLAQHNCLRYALYPYGDDWRFDGPGGQPVSARVSGNLVTNSAETMRAVALNGQGIFLAPSFVVGEDVQAGRLVRLLADYPPVEFAINAIYPHRQHLSTKVRSFIDLAAERFAEHRTWLEPQAAAKAGVR
jgi:DNA-binding transcriptional LysR family regulator